MNSLQLSTCVSSAVINAVIYANLSLISLGKSACVYPSPIPFVTSSGVNVGRL